MTPKWLDRELIQAPLWYTLVTSEAMYYAECKRIKVPVEDWGVWINPPSSATTSHFTLPNGRVAVIISIRVDPGRDPIQVAALLVHEAVHVWQRICRIIGETEPSSEFEAYSIQWISQELMNEFVRQTKPKAPKRKGS